MRYTEVFRRFRAHYGFDSSLCNPHAGHEKGNVEAKVGAIRRSLFVPVPSAWSFEGFNAALFDKCMGLAEKPHYRKDGREIELFAHDRAALLPLPDVAMDVVEYRRMKADKYGIIILERRHRYLAGAEHAGRELIVGLRAGSVEILDAKGAPVAMHERAYGEQPTNSQEPITQLETLCHRPNAWRNSQVRDALPDPLAAWLDLQDGLDRQAHLRTLLTLSRDNGWEHAVKAMDDTLEATGGLDPASVELQASRLAAGQDPIEYDDPIDLSEYDIAFRH